MPREIHYFTANSKSVLRIRLHKGLIAGRLDGDRHEAEKKLPPASSAALFLATSDNSICPLGAESAQLSIDRRNGEYWITNGARDFGDCRLNGDPFTRWKLLMNDRITISDRFEFRFEGDSLAALPTRKDETVIHVQGLKKAHPGTAGFLAVNDLSLTIKAGEFVGVIGPSGCGKTTFLNLLTGALRPTDGFVRVNGADPCDADEASRGKIGFVPQKDIVHRDLTVWQAVSMSADLRLPRSASAAVRNDLVERVLFDLGLGDHFHHQVKTLSGGQKKRVSIAVEILKETNVLILDEPSAGLDPASEEKLIDKLRVLSQQGRTVVCTTHMLELANLFDKILFMARGRQLHFESPHGIATALGTRPPEPEEIPFLRTIFHGLEDDDSLESDEEESETGYRTYYHGIEVHISLLDKERQKIAATLLRHGKSVLIDLKDAPQEAEEIYGIVFRLWRISRDYQKESRVGVIHADGKFEEILQANRRTGMISVFKNRQKAIERFQFGRPNRCPR